MMSMAAVVSPHPAPPHRGHGGPLIAGPGTGTQLGRTGGAAKNYAASLERERNDG